MCLLQGQQEAIILATAYQEKKTALLETSTEWVPPPPAWKAAVKLETVQMRTNVFLSSPETQRMVLQSALVKWASLGSPQCLLNKKRIDISRSFNILPVCKPEVGFCISVMVKSEANIGVCF